jgi:hypothetical protein
MCIILGPVESVSKTKLFVLPNKEKTRQMTFYSNNVNTSQTNMMILPVPTGGENLIELHTIKYPNLFEDLKESVQSTYRPHLERNYLSRSLYASASPRDTLEIFDHGSYRVSIAPQLEDLLRLDMRVFELTPDLYHFFARHYNREFSFLCCVLKPGVHSYEPLCYSHPLHSSGKLFVPTMHYHVHDGKVETESADWDHLIYSTNTSERANLGFTSNYNNELSWKRFPEEYQKLKVTSVRCAKLSGHQKNQDISFELW